MPGRARRPALIPIITVAALLLPLRAILPPALRAILPPALPAAHAAPADVLGLPLPPGTRIDTAAAGERGHRFVSGRGLRATIDFYQRFLTRRGLRHEAIPVYRYRGTEIARFLSRQPGTAWSAVHVYRHDARTWIFIVPRSP